jgi:hypothetical protein
MKMIKQFKRTVSFFLSFLILYTSTNSCTTPSIDLPSNSVLEKYSSKDIFQGIFFLQGDFVDEIPSLKIMKAENEIFQENQFYLANLQKRQLNKNEADNQVSIEAQVDSLFTSVEKVNPLIFDELKVALKTDNPVVIKEAIGKSGLVIKTALLQNENFSNGIALTQDAYEKGDIDLKDYDFNKSEDLQRYNDDMMEFIKNSPEHSHLADTDVAAFAFVFLVYAFLFVFWGIYLGAAIGGEVAIIIGNWVFLYNFFWWADRAANDGGDDLKYNQLISDLIEI